VCIFPHNETLSFLPRDASAERGYEIAFVCPSVCLSVRLSVRNV